MNKFKLFIHIFVEELWDMYSELFSIPVAIGLAILLPFLANKFTFIVIVFKAITVVIIAMFVFIFFLLMPYMVIHRAWQRYKEEVEKSTF